MYRSATSVPIQELGSEWPSSERKLQQTILDFAQKVWLMLFGNFSTAKKQKPLSSEWIYICIFADLILIGFVYWLCSGLVACIWRLFLFCNFATLGDPVQKRRRHPKPSQLHLSFKLLHSAHCTMYTVHSYTLCTLHTVPYQIREGFQREKPRKKFHLSFKLQHCTLCTIPCIVFRI